MEGAAQTILGSAGQLLYGEYQQLRGVGGEIAELRYDLETMNALLVMQSEAEDGAVDRFVGVWMKQLRELAYDSEDCVDLYRLRIKFRHSGGVRTRLQHLLETLFPRHRLAGEIRALRARATAICERHARYGINREALRRSAALSVPPVLLSASASTAEALRPSSNDNGAGDDADTADGGKQFVGIGNQADTLVNKLQDRAHEKGYPKVLSIVGFGGVGKTTLALELCRRLEAEFPYQAMVSVSQAFEPSRDMKTLLKRVLEQVVMPKTKNEGGIKEEGNLGGLENLNEEGLAGKLKEILNKDKRYLILVDDVWTTHAWEQIQHSLKAETNCGSRLIVTTRIVSVAKACSSAGYIHHMEPLNLEDSKKLFLSRVFGSTSSAKCPKELNEVMDKILNRCGGLPLAIVSIASVLAGYKSAGSRDKWESVCRSIGSQMESNPTLEGMRHIVTLSYNHLPHELKNCMMYLSIFPEDYEINIDRLLGRWITEGLVPEKRGLTSLEVAELYLDELMSRNMVVPRYGHDGKVESCRVHDMLLEVMVCKSLECNFVSLLGGQYAGMSYGRIRRLSIHGEDDYGKKGMDVEHARSLSMFQVPKAAGRKLLDQLGSLSLLRVLDLEDCEALTNTHMKYVCRLYLLRFLSVKGTDISVMPPEVGKLEHLQTLDARDTRIVGELPETMTSLEKLECVKFSHKTEWYVMWTLRQGISKMKALREARAQIKKDVQVAEELGKLQQLQDFDLYINCENDEKVLKQVALSLSKMYSLRSLGMAHFGDSGLAFLHKLPAPPQLLRYLRIDGGIGEKLPDWVGSLTNLVEFQIMRPQLDGDELFGVLCNLPNLKSIALQQACYKGEKLVALTKHNFPALSDLKLYSDWIAEPTVLEFEKESMTRLQTLHVNFRKLERRSIVGIEHLTSLREVQLTGKKENRWLQAALEQLKEEKSKRSQQFQIIVKYE